MASSSVDPTARPPGVDDKNETFVFKLYRMVEDPGHQHLLAWSPGGLSFVVYNGSECAREVLPKYFKHNNFSSFVRQLNMYGFHKVNESPRSPRSSADQQVWEFSHPRFLRGRPDLLVDIRRKVVNSGSGGRSPPHFSQDLEMDPVNFVLPTANFGANAGAVPPTSIGVKRSFESDNEPPSSVEVMQAFQNEIIRQMADMQDTMQILFHEAAETRRQLGVYQQATRKLIECLSRQQAIMPAGLPRAFEPQDFLFLIEEHRRATSPDPSMHPQPAIVVSGEGGLPQFPKVIPSQVRPQSSGLYPGYAGAPGGMALDQQLTHRRTTSFTNAVNTPIPPSPLASPYVSPHGSPHRGSPLQDQLIDEESYVRDDI